jgi:uncharacterized phiE125 gp8 family phage protein
MSWSLSLVAPPATEVLTLEQAKQQSRIDFNDDDDYFTFLCTAARVAVEEHTSRSLITQTWALGVPHFPWRDRILLPRGPVQSVASVTYTDSTQTQFTMLQGTDYLLDLSQELAQVVVPFGRTWPTAVLSTAAPITITFVGGYGATAAAVPAPIVIAIKQLTASWYDNRESYALARTTQAAVELPMAFQALLNTYRLRYSGPF